jgi:large subunit ribosomal protein L18
MKKITIKSDLLRLKAFRSNKSIYAQVINAQKRVTTISANDLKLNDSKKKTKKERAREVGLTLAKKLLKLNINQLVFDRGSYQYAGRIKALIEGIREGGIKI